MRESRTYGFVRGVPGHSCRDSQGEVGENLGPVGLPGWFTQLGRGGGGGPSSHAGEGGKNLKWGIYFTQVGPIYDGLTDVKFQLLLRSW